MKLQDDISNMNTHKHTYTHTSRNQYVPHFFKVGGIKKDNTVFAIITLWKLSVAMETTVLIQSGPKPIAAFPPNPIMLQIKSDCNWPACCRDIRV